MADDPKTYTQDELDAVVAERIAAEVTGLKKNRDETLKELKTLKSQYAGIEPERVKELESKLAEIERDAKASKAGVTSDTLVKLRAEARAELEKEFGPSLKERDALKAENRSLRLDTVVKGVMAKAGARAERIDALFRLSSDRFDLTDDGKPMVRDTAKEVDKFVAEDLAKEYPEFFTGTGSSGGGASKSVAGGAGPRVIAAGDNAAFLAHAKGIAEGKVEVR